MKFKDKNKHKLLNDEDDDESDKKQKSSSSKKKSDATKVKSPKNASCKEETLFPHLESENIVDPKNDKCRIDSNIGLASDSVSIVIGNVGIGSRKTVDSSEVGQDVACVGGLNDARVGVDNARLSSGVTESSEARGLSDGDCVAIGLNNARGSSRARESVGACDGDSVARDTSRASVSSRSSRSSSRSSDSRTSQTTWYIPVPVDCINEPETPSSNGQGETPSKSGHSHTSSKSDGQYLIDWTWEDEKEEEKNTGTEPVHVFPSVEKELVAGVVDSSSPSSSSSSSSVAATAAAAALQLASIQTATPTFPNVQTHVQQTSSDVLEVGRHYENSSAFGSPHSNGNSGAMVVNSSVEEHADPKEVCAWTANFQDVLSSECTPSRNPDTCETRSGEKWGTNSATLDTSVTSQQLSDASFDTSVTSWCQPWRDDNTVESLSSTSQQWSDVSFDESMTSWQPLRKDSETSSVYSPQQKQKSDGKSAKSLDSSVSEGAAMVDNDEHNKSMLQLLHDQLFR
jgi:hypothetical protein